MKAAVVERYGDADVVTIVEQSNPRPGDKDVLVRVHRAPVDSADVRMRGMQVEGIFRLVMPLVIGFGKPRNPVLGTVFAGVVEAVGSAVSKFSVGDRVYGGGGLKNGSHKELLVINEQGRITHMPTTASFAEAAALPFGGQTALHFIGKAGLSSGDQSLVYGASGAVGAMAVQVLKAQGITVTGVCSAENRELVLSLGADRVLDYRSKEFAENTDQYDYIFDAVGFFPKARAQEKLAPKGKYASVASLEVASESVEMLNTLAEWFDQGKIRAVIDQEFPFAEVVEAHRYVDTKRKRGSVLLAITE